jgi:hypothetical protein
VKRYNELGIEGLGDRRRYNQGSEPLVNDIHQAHLWQALQGKAPDGGFLGRKLDGFPGIKTLWRGWQRLHDIAFTWKLAHSSPVSETYG